MSYSLEQVARIAQDYCKWSNEEFYYRGNQLPTFADWSQTPQAQELLKPVGEDWISAEVIPPNSEDVLCADDKTQWVGVYAHEKKIAVENDDDEPNDLDCDEQRGECYLKPGWYELEECYGGTYDEVWMKRSPTHWQPLPKPPKHI